MILHCTPPYRQDIPNPATGYLKGFLEARGIHVKNVYWNLILAREILNYQKTWENCPGLSGLSPTYNIVLQICKHLLMEDSNALNETLSDAFFSLFSSKKEISTITSLIRDQIDQYILQNNLHETPLAGFTLKTEQWLMNFYLIQRLKELNSEIKIVIGGIPDEDGGRVFMKMIPLADFAIWGEGEYPLFYLIEALERDKELKNVPNLIYRNNDRILSTEMSREPHSDLNSYPFADHSDYFTTLRKFFPGQMKVLIPIWGSRSCPWNKCKFCVLNEGYLYRQRSPENIVEEIEVQSGKYGIRTFIFVDSDIAGNKKRFKKLLKLLLQSSEKKGIPYELYAELSPIFIDPETAPYMELISLKHPQIGAEALTDSLLEKMQKRHKFAHNIQALKLGDQYNLRVSSNIITGIPTETREDVLESCKNLRFLRFFLKQFTFILNSFKLFKGSPFYDEMPEETRKHWNESEVWDEITQIPATSEVDRFELAGFLVDELSHYLLWNFFQRHLGFHIENTSSYEWIEYPDCSFFAEKGPKTYRCILNRDETDLLIYCDSIKRFSEVRSKFPHMSEDTLLAMMSQLKDPGLLYYDTNLETIISVLEADRRKISSCLSGKPEGINKRVPGSPNTM